MKKWRLLINLRHQFIPVEFLFISNYLRKNCDAIYSVDFLFTCDVTSPTHMISSWTTMSTKTARRNSVKHPPKERPFRYEEQMNQEQRDAQQSQTRKGKRRRLQVWNSDVFQVFDMTHAIDLIDLTWTFLDDGIPVPNHHDEPNSPMESVPSKLIYRFLLIHLTQPIKRFTQVSRNEKLCVSW